MSGFTKSVVEEAALAWLEGSGYAALHGPDIAASEPSAERNKLNHHSVGLDWTPRSAAIGWRGTASG